MSYKISYNRYLCQFMLSGTIVIGSLRFWVLSVECAILANVCFFAGPIVEIYVYWLGWKTKVVRVVLFTLGFVFSVALTIMSVVMYVNCLNLF